MLSCVSVSYNVRGSGLAVLLLLLFSCFSSMLLFSCFSRVSRCGEDLYGGITDALSVSGGVVCVCFLLCWDFFGDLTDDASARVVVLVYAVSTYYVCMYVWMYVCMYGCMYVC